MIKWKKALIFQQVNRNKALGMVKRYPSQKGEKNKKRKSRKGKVKKNMSLKKRMKPIRVQKLRSSRNMGMKKKKRILKGKKTPRNSYPPNPPSNARCSSETQTKKKKTQGQRKKLPRIRRLKSKGMKRKVTRNHPRRNHRCLSGLKSN